ncbi:hypothetical protein FJZ36_03900 [Candidatus Poribacteria bacterium]|nr:hypothetical protein [Candidatus Poribacteria bacterium]
MAEETIDGITYLSLKDVARVLSKQEAALRARIKRGSLAAVQRPMATGQGKSKRFRYMIPFESVKEELASDVRKDPVLQKPLAEGDEPNLYQMLWAILAQHRDGLAISELQWQLERYHGLSFSVESIGEFLAAFAEFSETNGLCRLRHTASYDAASAKPTPIVREHVRSSDASEAMIRQFETRLNTLESKIELLIQLLSKRLT